MLDVLRVPQYLLLSREVDVSVFVFKPIDELRHNRFLLQLVLSLKVHLRRDVDDDILVVLLPGLQLRSWVHVSLGHLLRCGVFVSFLLHGDTLGRLRHLHPALFVHQRLLGIQTYLQKGAVCLCNSLVWALSFNHRPPRRKGRFFVDVLHLCRSWVLVTLIVQRRCLYRSACLRKEFWLELMLGLRLLLMAVFRPDGVLILNFLMQLLALLLEVYVIFEIALCKAGFVPIF